MAHKHHPRRGSLAFKPRVRARRQYPVLKFAKEMKRGGKTLAGFGGYKVGMTRIMISEKRGAKRVDIAKPVTVIECPPMTVYGVRFYRDGYTQGRYGKEVLKDIIADNISRDLKRKVNLKKAGSEKDFDSINLEEIVDIRLLVHSQPRRIGLKKTPDNLELPLHGNLEEKLVAAKEWFRKEIRISDVFQDGEFLDALGVTKGKGTQGPVKRHGVKLLSHKAEKGRRAAGNMGAWHPAYTDWRAPLSGQMGYHNRTEYSKWLVKVGSNPDDVNPSGGFKNYGIIKEDYVLIHGSLPGATKRFVLFRPAVRNRELKKSEVSFVLR